MTLDEAIVCCELSYCIFAHGRFILVQWRDTDEKQGVCIDKLQSVHVCEDLSVWEKCTFLQGVAFDEYCKTHISFF